MARLTEQKGSIIKAETGKIIGTWFVVSNRFGAVSKDDAFNRLLTQFRKNKILFSDGIQAKRTTLHQVPLNYLRTSFAAGGFHLLEETVVEEFLRAGEVPALPIEFGGTAETYFNSPRYYVVRKRDERIVGMAWFRLDGTSFEFIEDEDLKKIIKAKQGKKVDIPVSARTPSNPVIRETRVKKDFDQLGVPDLQDQLGPNFYLVPAGFVEVEEGFFKED